MPARRPGKSWTPRPTAPSARTRPSERPDMSSARAIGVRSATWSRVSRSAKTIPQIPLTSGALGLARVPGSARAQLAHLLLRPAHALLIAVLLIGLGQPGVGVGQLRRDLDRPLQTCDPLVRLPELDEVGAVLRMRQRVLRVQPERALVVGGRQGRVLGHPGHDREQAQSLGMIHEALQDVVEVLERPLIFPVADVAERAATAG